jgi:fibronectin type 3 domain-containing protein
MSDLPDEPIARSVTDLSYTDEEVQNGTTYYYRITAASAPEVESESSNEDAATPFAPPPERP